MPHPRRTHRYLSRAFLLAGLGLVAAVASAPADVVILKDGFVIQGTVRKELETVRDPATGRGFSVPRAAGFDYIDDGPRLIVFSSHNRQLGEINKDVKLRPEYKAYLNRIESRRSSHPLPFMGGAKSTPDFNAKWRRTIEVKVPPNGFDRIEQQVTYLDPYCCFVVSPTHSWSQAFRTSEMDPQKVRKLLSTHPELAEPDGKPDPLKRIAIARFMKDVGWLFVAKQEVERLKKDVPGPLAKDAQEQLDKLLKDIDAATAELVVREAELAVNAGRYQYADLLLGAFPEKMADPKALDRATKLMAQVNATKEHYETGRRLLRNLIDEVTGGGAAKPFLAVAGGPITPLLPNKAATPQLAEMSAAAEEVAANLHPDSTGRIEFFVSLAGQAEREKGQGKPATKKPEDLLATAISGWAKGKNGATPDPAAALRIWRARAMVLNYQRAQTLNERNAMLGLSKKENPVSLDELTQIISLLPPAEPENLVLRTGTPVKPGNGVPEGVYKRTSAPFGEHPAGIDYFVKLPPEYHHGRAYPVLVVLSYPGLDAEKFMGAVAADADKNGYILLAPDWAPAFGRKTGWEWDGADHEFVTAALRDAVRHFTIDNDRVFMIGVGAGADMAMDVGVSHPDLFAGVLAVGPNPKWQGMFMYYWQNAQKLPMYVVTGELAGDTNTNLRRLFEPWMRRGFPALEVVYRGRGFEWYPAETPVMFDWMNRKKRANGTAVLALGTDRPLPWQTMRESDNHFYWLGADKIHPGNLTPDGKAASNVLPAELYGDIKGNNLIELRSRGVRTISVWLGRDMIDWSKKLLVTVNGSRPNGWTPRVVEQDIHVLLEDYWHRGDRRMLFLARLEFPNPN